VREELIRRSHSKGKEATLKRSEQYAERVANAGSSLMTTMAFNHIHGSC
jgi:hypothetical protein